MSAQGPSASGAEGSDLLEPEGDPLDVRLAWPGEAEAFAPSNGREDARDDDRLLAEVATATTVQPPDDVELPSSAVSMLVDAYERLGGRVLSRLRDLRADVDADVAELRSEVSSLRAAIEDVADRVQLRQLRTSVDELRSDVAALRSAVLEWPELERMASDVSALRSASSDLLEAIAPPDGTGGPTGAPAADGLSAMLQEQLDAVTEELAGLREEMVSLRRRIALRADAGGLRPEELEAVADAVAQRVLQKIRPAATRPG